MKAADLLKDNHPLRRAFVAFVVRNNAEQKPTVRQARKFLQKYPNYRIAA